MSTGQSAPADDQASPLLPPPPPPPLPSSLGQDSADEDLTFTLPSGRVLGYARYGVARSSFPTTFYLHGYPASRIEAAVLRKDLVREGLQVVAVDRPGFGLSKHYPGRSSVLEHAEDVSSLAEHLGLTRFAVLGVSGGAPYALACAKAIAKERLVGVGVVSGLGPYELVKSAEVWKELWWLNKLGFVAAERLPWLYRLVYGWLAPMLLRKAEATSFEKVVSSAEFQRSTAADRAALLRLGEDGFKDGLRSVREAMRQEGWARWHVEEAQLVARPWNFRLEDIACDNVVLWYGSKDTSTPLSLGRKIAELTPRARLEVVQDGTHSSVMLDSVNIVKHLISR